MRVEIGFEIDKKGFDLKLASLDRKTMRKVLQKTINKTLGNVRAEVSRQARDDRAIAKSKNSSDTGTPAKFVASRTKLKKASLFRSDGEVTISRKGVSLIRYSPIQTTLGVTVKVKRDGSRKLIKHAFIAKLARGNIHVVARVGKNLKALYSTTVSDATANRMAKIVAYGQQQFEKNLLALLKHHS